MAQHKAWTYYTTGYPQALSLTTQPTPDPTILKPTYLQIKIKSAALNPVDVQLMNLPIWSLPYLNSWPKGVGEDFSGIVISAGPEAKAKGFKEGDEVFGIHMGPGGPGTVAEIFTADVEADTILRKPSGWNWNQAAALPLVWLTARTCIDRVEPYMQAQGSNKTLVLGGSSGVGMYVVLLAKQRGWKTVATCSSRNSEFVASMGASSTIEYTSSDVRTEVTKLSPTAIIDCVGGTECLGIAQRYVTIVGDKTSRSSMGGSAIYLWNPQMYFRRIIGRVPVIGRLFVKEVYDCINLDMHEEWLKETLELDQEKILIDSTYGFDDLKGAFERLNTGRSRGKVVIEVEK